MELQDFKKLSIRERVDLVNQLFNDFPEFKTLQEVAEHLDLSPSTMSSLLAEGDYVFIKREQRFYPFVRDHSLIINQSEKPPNNLTYLEENLNQLKRIIEREKGSLDFRIDPRVVRPTKDTTTSRNVKLPDTINEEFSRICDELFPYLKVQDIHAHVLLEFCDRYRDALKK